MIPIVFTQSRKYMIIGFINHNIIVNNKCFTMPNASKYDFGILSSIVHMDWVSLNAGKYGGSYEYSSKVIYNTFPWPNTTSAQKQAISKTAQAILDARKHHNGESLADLYNPLAMPSDLQKAHRDNDKAVLKAYGLNPNANKNEIVTKLLKMYAKLAK